MQPLNPTLLKEALSWAASAAGYPPQAFITHPLPGATSSHLFRLSPSRSTGGRELVLRLFTNQEWLAEDPEVTRHEVAGLQQAGALGLPAPELVAYDDGLAFGVQALLMTALPGSVLLNPPDRPDWLRQMAEAIVPAHLHPAGEFPWSYAPYTDLASLQPPLWSRCPELWAQAISIVQGPPPQFDPVFIHRDYHPNNVLFLDGKLSGIVDWPNACQGASGIDPAWCRHNLAMIHGAETAAAFLEAYRAAYQRAAGRPFEYHPYWDLITLVEILPEVGVYEGWTAHGLTGLTHQLLASRADDYLEGVLREL